MAQCDEARPECLGCTKRGVRCSGYERTISFKDVSDQAAEASRKFEEARWAAIRIGEDLIRNSRKRARASQDPDSAITAASEQSPGDSAIELTTPGVTEDVSGRDRSMALSDLLCHQPPTPQPSSHPRAPSTASWQPTTTAQTYTSSNFQSPVDPGLYRSIPSYNSPALLDYEEQRRRASQASVASFQRDLRLQVPITELPLSPSHIAADANEAALIAHFENELIPKLPVPMTFGPSYMENSCFRNAILALASVSKCSKTISAPPGSEIPIPTTQLRRSAVGREFYGTAVSELYHHLDSSDPTTTKHHAAAALMLAYYEIETGSSFGSLRHARGLDALLSRLDITGPEALLGGSGQQAAVGPLTPPIPQKIFKAWRMLRYDVRFISAPYRHTPLRRDVYDPYAAYDPQLAIRDAYTLTWNLCGRVLQEVSFPLDPEKGSRSKQFAIWVRDVAGRTCDRRNVELGDYHKDDITDEEIIQRCQSLTRALDAWHSTLPESDKPIPKVGEANPFLTGRSFDPILILGFSGGYWKAFEYEMYLSSRMMISYLISVYGSHIPSGPRSSPAETAAWSNMLFGVVCGMQQRQMSFSYVATVNNICLAAMLCEGTTAINAVLDGVIPYVLSKGLPQADLPDWLYLQKGMEICRKERLRGKAIRGAYLTLDEDYEKGHFDPGCSFVAFGDYNGKGFFRGLYSIDGDYVDRLV